MVDIWGVIWEDIWEIYEDCEKFGGIVNGFLQQLILSSWFLLLLELYIFDRLCCGLPGHKTQPSWYSKVQVVGAETEVHKHDSSKHRNSKVEEPQAQFAGHNTVNT